MSPAGEQRKHQQTHNGSAVRVGLADKCRLTHAAIMLDDRSEVNAFKINNLCGTDLARPDVGSNAKPAWSRWRKMQCFALGVSNRLLNLKLNLDDYLAHRLTRCQALKRASSVVQ